MPMTKWRIELHSHTLYSQDCLTSLKRFVETCQKRGLNKVAVTDHNTAEGALAMAKLAPELVIVGEEIMTTQGELLAFFVKETIPARLSPQEAIKRLRDQGAFISVSHPYDRLRKGAWAEADLLAIIDQVDAIETFNARCIYGEDNHKAQQFAAQRGKLGTVGSDAHIPFELGRAILNIAPFEDAVSFGQALLQAIPETRLSPTWVHVFSKYAKTLRKRGWSKMPTTPNTSTT